MGRYIGEHRDDGFHFQELLEGLPAWFRRYGWTVAVAALGLLMLVWSWTMPAHAETTLQNLGQQPKAVSIPTPRPTSQTPAPTPVAQPQPPATSSTPVKPSATTPAPTPPQQTTTMPA